MEKLQTIRLHEVAPRDGLQNEGVMLSVDVKMQLLERLASSRPASIEVGSFVRPDLLPQMADTPEVCARLADAEWALEARTAGVRFAGLVPNRRGFERILKTNLDEITLLVSATDGHSKANVNKTVAEALEESSALIHEAREAGRFSRLYISMAFRCPIEGQTDPAQVLDIVRAVYEAGADRILLSDTLGVAERGDVEQLVAGVLNFADPYRIGLHMHDTYGHAVENCHAAWEMGIADFDAATGGTGGCPFAPGAKGNLATEELLDVLPSWGASCATDLQQIRATAAWLGAELLQGDPVPNRA
ncbi:MAG: hydroxymethylglutaryl-CoA lyase [Planctomycetes bacterium]|nr:hydroxymethylglutaryl-CoA lyase [Planctomycetota bacterium]